MLILCQRKDGHYLAPVFSIEGIHLDIHLRITMRGHISWFRHPSNLNPTPKCPQQEGPLSTTVGAIFGL